MGPERISYFRSRLLKMNMDLCGARHEWRWAQIPNCPEAFQENSLFCVHSQNKLMLQIVLELFGADVLNLTGRDILTNTLNARKLFGLDHTMIVVTEALVAIETSPSIRRKIPNEFCPPNQPATRKSVIRRGRELQRELGQSNFQVRAALLWILRQINKRKTTPVEINAFLRLALVDKAAA